MAIRTLPIALASASLFGCSRATPSGTDTLSPTHDTASAPRAEASSAPAAGVDAVPPLPAGEGALDPPEAKEARERLVVSIRDGGAPWESSSGWDARVLDAMRSVRRHLFMPGAPLRAAYDDRPYPIGHGQTISQPTIVAIMSDALNLTGTERVLEIGTGSGYQAAVLGALTREVFTIEIVEALGVTAKKRLEELGYRNVHVRVGDGYKGWPEKGPFDRVLLTAAPPEIPAPLVEQLKDGGILVAPVGDEASVQRLVRWTKRGGRLDKEDLGAVRFVPMVKSQ